MKSMLLALCLTACTWAVSAQTTSFPEITCQTLSGKTIQLPADMKGKKTVVVIAMSLKAEKELRNWTTPLYNSLLAPGIGGLMGGNLYQANVCFVGMLKGVAKLAPSEIKDKARQNIDKKLWDNYMITEKDVKAFMVDANISNTDEPHFFVLDKEGRTIYYTSGKYSDEKLDEITGKLLQ
ncbi:MAG: hypothetical protein ACK445_06385 [Bacteroidota bacterium]|jgi:hypothetical protein